MEQNDTKNKRFFYANEINAGLYDGTIELVVPFYKELHEMMNYLIINEIKTKNYSENSEILLLDIGSGTGNDSIPLLDVVPNLKIVALDFMEPMHGIYKGNLGNKQSNVEFLIADILDDKLSTTMSQQFKKGFNVIISAFTIHHFCWDDKVKIYDLIYRLLGQDGIFVNGDLFNFNDDLISQYAHKFDINFIIDNFKRTAQNYINGNRKIEKLGELWKLHYESDNLLNPINDQIKLLKSLGFTSVENPFRFWQVGLLYAKKNEK